MRPKFQKRSALKFDGRIIPEAKPSGIVVGLIPRHLGAVHRECAPGQQSLIVICYFVQGPIYFPLILLVIFISG